MERDATIARNKKRWTDMIKRRKPTNADQEATLDEDKTKKRGDVVVKSKRKKSNDEQAKKQQKRKHTGRESPETTHHNGVMV